MKNMPKLSIISVNLNNAKGLGKTMQFAINQNYQTIFRNTYRYIAKKTKKSYRYSANNFVYLQHYTDKKTNKVCCPNKYYRK